jgi:atypical dual specificity phosphatase
VEVRATMDDNADNASLVDFQPGEGDSGSDHDTTETGATTGPADAVETGAPSQSGPVRVHPPDAGQGPGSRAAVAARVDEGLWIANWRGVLPEKLDAMNLDPEYVVSVNQRPSEATTDHHPLDDGCINPYDEFTAAVEAARKRLQQDGTVIVNCAAGVSRSASVIATAVAAEQERAFGSVVDDIQANRDGANPHSKLKLSGIAYLAGIEDRPEPLRKREYRLLTTIPEQINERQSVSEPETDRFDTMLEQLVPKHPDNPGQ